MSSSEEISAQEINLEQVEQTEQPGDHEKEIVVNLPVANVKQETDVHSNKRKRGSLSDPICIYEDDASKETLMKRPKIESSGGENVKIPAEEDYSNDDGNGPQKHEGESKDDLEENNEVSGDGDGSDDTDDETSDQSYWSDSESEMDDEEWNRQQEREILENYELFTNTNQVKAEMPFFEDYIASEEMTVLRNHYSVKNLQNSSDAKLIIFYSESNFIPRGVNNRDGILKHKPDWKDNIIPVLIMLGGIEKYGKRKICYFQGKTWMTITCEKGDVEGGEKFFFNSQTRRPANFVSKDVIYASNKVELAPNVKLEIKRLAEPRREASYIERLFGSKPNRGGNVDSSLMSRKDIIEALCNTILKINARLPKNERAAWFTINKSSF